MYKYSKIINSKKVTITKTDNQTDTEFGCIFVKFKKGTEVEIFINSILNHKKDQTNDDHLKTDEKKPIEKFKIKQIITFLHTLGLNERRKWVYK